MSLKTVIIGATAAGLNFATRLRRVDEAAEIVVFEKKSDVGEATCCIPHYLAGETDQEGLFSRPLKTTKQWYNIKINTDHLVEAIKPDIKEIHVRNLKTNELVFEKYGNLVIATGGIPRTLASDIENLDKVENIHYVYSVSDALLLKEAIPAEKKKIAIIGAGNIGLEIADAFLKIGDTHISIIDARDQIIPGFDKDMAAFLEKEIESHGGSLYLNSKVTKFSVDGRKLFLDNNNEISFDLLIVAIGQKPNVKLAKDIGIKIGKTGAIKVTCLFEMNF